MKIPVVAVTILLALAPAALSQTPNGTWAVLAPSGPPARWGHVMVYDSRHDRVLIHGGWRSGVFYDDVWEYPLATNGPWHLLEPTGTIPDGRAFHSAIYDPIYDRMVIFGGYRGSALDDVWELDLGEATPAWQAVATTGTPPSARYWHSAVYNDRYQRMTVFGGEDGTTLFNDTAELELRSGVPSVWSPPPQPVGTPPPKRCCQEAVFVPEHARLVMYGGWNGSAELGDLWELPYTIFPSPGWTSLLGSGAIGARTDHVMALDLVRNRLIVHGGVLGPNRLGDVWELPLDGTPAWNALAPSGTAPSARSDHAAVYDPVRDRLIIYGGFTGLSDPLEDLSALSFGASTAIHLDCPGDGAYAPDDTVFVAFEFNNPYAAPTRFGYSVTGERAWPYASGGGDIGGFTPVVHFDWGIPVPDTATGGTNTFKIRVWSLVAPALEDSCAIHLVGATTAVLLSLIEKHATPDQVRLAWYSEGDAEAFALWRQDPGELWRPLASVSSDGSGRVAYVDRTVRTGRRYGYRLVDAAGSVRSEAWVDVPERQRFALHRAWHESRTLWLDVSLAADDGPARLDLVDSAGRRVLSRALTGADQRQRLSVPCDVPPGIYFARVAQGARSASGKVLVLD